MAVGAGARGRHRVNLLTFAPPWLALLPGLRFWQALMMTQATTALSLVVPGGAAVGIATAYGMLRRAGFGRRTIARSVTLVSLWNQLANLAYPIVAVFLLTIAGRGDDGARDRGVRRRGDLRRRRRRARARPLQQPHGRRDRRPGGRRSHAG